MPGCGSSGLVTDCSKETLRIAESCRRGHDSNASYVTAFQPRWIALQPNQRSIDLGFWDIRTAIQLMTGFVTVGSG